VVPEYKFKKGVKEVNFKFFDNNPPSIVYQNFPYKIIVEVDNLAAYDVDNGEVSINGLDKSYFLHVGEAKKTFGTLEGRGTSNPSGDKTFLEFDFSTEKLAINEKQFSNNFLLVAKYDSTLEFSDSVCLNPNVFDVFDGGCKVKSKKSYSGQGGPLAVTNLEEIISPGDSAEVEFRLKLRNKGKGEITTITLGKARLGNKELSCQFKGETINKKQVVLKSSKKEANLVCRGPIDSSNSYLTTIFFDFKYDYTYTKRKELTLRKE